jgi:hypothetical protein
MAPLAAAELGDVLLAAQPFQHDADILLSQKCRRVACRTSFDRGFRRLL